MAFPPQKNQHMKYSHIFPIFPIYFLYVSYMFPICFLYFSYMFPLDSPSGEVIYQWEVIQVSHPAATSAAQSPFLGAFAQILQSPSGNIEHGPFIGGFTHWKIAMYSDLMGFYSGSMGYSWDIPSGNIENCSFILDLPIENGDFP